MYHFTKLLPPPPIYNFYKSNGHLYTGLTEAKPTGDEAWIQVPLSPNQVAAPDGRPTPIKSWHKGEILDLHCSELETGRGDPPAWASGAFSTNFWITPLGWQEGPSGAPWKMFWPRDWSPGVLGPALPLAKPRPWRVMEPSRSAVSAHKHWGHEACPASCRPIILVPTLPQASWELDGTAPITLAPSWYSTMSWMRYGISLLC